MKRTIATLLVLLLALAAAGCGDDAGEATTTTAPATTAAAGGAALAVSGSVAEAKAFTTADLEALEVVELTLEHPRNGATPYRGVRLNALLDLAGIDAAATALTFTAADGYSYEAALADVRACADCLVAFDDEGGLTLAMPGMESKAWVKGVVEIAAG